MKLLMSITHVSETLAIPLNREEANNEVRKLYRFYFSVKMLLSFIQIIVGVRNETDFTIDASGTTKQSIFDLLVPFLNNIQYIT